MEGTSIFNTAKFGRGKEDNPSPDSNNNTITQYKGDSRKHYVWHCNGSVGCIFEGTHDQCRAYLMSSSRLQKTCIVVDEPEHLRFTSLSEQAIRSYFLKLRIEAQSYE